MNTLSRNLPALSRFLVEEEEEGSGSPKKIRKTLTVYENEVLRRIFET
jgi:hypothetical protein